MILKLVLVMAFLGMLHEASWAILMVGSSAKRISKEEEHVDNNKKKIGEVPSHPKKQHRYYMKPYAKSSCNYILEHDSRNKVPSHTTITLAPSPIM